jgi:hypothetical protein
METDGQTLFGVGPILGEPTGGTLKLWFGPRIALQSHQAVTWWGLHRLAVYLDVVWHPSVVTENKYFTLLWYFGVGGGVGIRAPWDRPAYHPRDPDRDRDWEPDPAVWIRVPFGFPFLFEDVPVEAFVEFGPAMGFDYRRDDVDLFFAGFIAVGGRWYFQ